MLSFSSAVTAYDKTDIMPIIKDTANIIITTNPEPSYGSIGGEWAIIGLARSDLDIPLEYFEKYYNSILNYIKSNNGILHQRKYTEYARIVIALSALNKQPENISGYNLLLPLSDFEKTRWQGINGSIYALIAIDCKELEIPTNQEAEIQATRLLYIEDILSKQLPEGAFSLNGKTPEADITAMALQALAPYLSEQRVSESVEKAISWLSSVQDEHGGFSSFGNKNAESVSQVIIALCELGIDINDERFVKNGNSLLDNLLTFYQKGKGFVRGENDEINMMSTEQAFCALVSLYRYNECKNSLYNMKDVVIDLSEQESRTLNKDVKIPEIQDQYAILKDIQGHINQKAIEDLLSRGIVSGNNDGFFLPEKEITRAEFSAMIVKALGLPQNNQNPFTDVSPTSWYSDFVSTAYSYNIIAGKASNLFKPNDKITREEAAIMIAKSAVHLGHNTSMSSDETRNVLAQFTDYKTSSNWALESLAFCYSKNIMDQSSIHINPKTNILRKDVAEMLYRLIMQ